MHDTDTTDRHCASAEHCKAYDRTAKPPHPAWVDTIPLCDTCLDTAARDIRTLVYDYLDLAQMQIPTLSQALDTQPHATADPPMPLRGEPDALQREIWHVTTTWETEVRAAAGLSEPDRDRPGADVQRAVATLTPRLRQLAALPPTTVYPTGCEDPPTDVAGWEAVRHMQRLRERARSMLGWTRRKFWVPGECWQDECATQHRQAVAAQRHDPTEFLYRSEPEQEGDEPPIYCRYCDKPRSYDDYQRYLRLIVWPGITGAAA